MSMENSAQLDPQMARRTFDVLLLRWHFVVICGLDDGDIERLHSDSVVTTRSDNTRQVLYIPSLAMQSVVDATMCDYV